MLILLQSIVIFLPCIYLSYADTFVDFCLSPPLFGQGELGKTKLNEPMCTMKFNVSIPNKDLNKVRQLCKTVSPFELMEFKLATEVICIYKQVEFCDPEEQGFLGFCFVVGGTPGNFKKDECTNAANSTYKLHTVESRDEIKWLSAIFSAEYPELWVANIGDSAKHLEPVPNPRLAFEADYKPNEGSSPIKIRLEKGGLDGLKVGTAIYGHNRGEQVFHLCSRSAAEADYDYPDEETQRILDEEEDKKREQDDKADKDREDEDERKRKQDEEDKEREREEEDKKKNGKQPDDQEEKQDEESSTQTGDLEEKHEEETTTQPDHVEMKHEEETTTRPDHVEKKHEEETTTQPDHVEKKHEEETTTLPDYEEETEEEQTTTQPDHVEKKEEETTTLPDYEEEPEEEQTTTQSDDARKKQDEKTTTKGVSDEEKKRKEDEDRVREEEQRKRDEEEKEKKRKKVEKQMEEEIAKIKEEDREEKKKTPLERYGIPYHVQHLPDKSRRTYMYFGTVHAVESSEFEPDFTELHEICKLYPDGYAVSRADFQDEKEFEEIIKKFDRMPLRVAVGRYNSKQKSDDCKAKVNPDTYRQHFRYHHEKTGKIEVFKAFWAKGYPKNACADKPRITAAMTHRGYVDVPAFARLPVLCGYGTRPPPKRFKVCGRGASYDEVKDECKCHDEEFDGRKLDPEKYGKHPPGTVCLSCDTTTESRSIMFILDSSGSVQHSGWQETLNFMERIIKAVRKVRTALIKVVDLPTINEGFAERTPEQLKQMLDRHRGFVGRTTKIGYSLHLAREALLKETTTHKAIVLVTDGDDDYCSQECQQTLYAYNFPPPPPIIGGWTTVIHIPFIFGGLPTVVPAPLPIPFGNFHTFGHVQTGFATVGGVPVQQTSTQEAKLMEYKQNIEADKVRAAGIRLVYVAVGPYLNPWNPHYYRVKNNIHLVSAGQAIVGPNDQYKFDNKILEETVNRVCNPIS